VFVTEGQGTAARTVEVLGGGGHSRPPRHPGGRERPRARRHLRRTWCNVARGSIDWGFVDPALKLAVLTETDLSGQKAARQGRAAHAHQAPQDHRPLTLEAGDFIVHEQHGVGRYVEMVQRTVQGATREYLLVEYAAAKRGSPATGLYIRPTSWSRCEVRRRRGPDPAPARRRGLDEDQAAREEGRQETPPT